jgi:hypothetical protein
MASISWQRRRFLKALGAQAAMLPFYSLLERSAVQAQSLTPMRLLLLYSNYGGLWENFRPRGLSGPDAALTPASISYPGSALASLAPFTSQMTIVEGLALTAGLLPVLPANGERNLYIGHEHTAPSAWTGAVVRDTTDDSLPESGSLDFVLGQQFGQSTAVRSIQIGMGGAIGNTRGDTIAYNATGQRLPGFARPIDAFHQLFGTTTSAPPGQSQTAREKSVLAAVQSGAKRLQSRLAGPERVKLDEHLSALADIEARLTTGVSQVVCATPTAPAATDGRDHDRSIIDDTKDHLAIIRQGFACDRTRFINAGWNVSGGIIPGLLDASVTDMHGQVAHVIDNTTAVGVKARADMTLVQKWHADRLAELATALSQTSDGSGSLLDNTLIVWGQDFGEGVHGGLNMPYVLLGGAQKKLRMGRYLDATNPGATDRSKWRTFKAHNQLLVSIANAFGSPVNTFGSTEFVGPLAGLT